MGRTLNTFRLWGPNLMFIASRVGWLGSEEKSEICSGFLFVCFSGKKKKKGAGYACSVPQGRQGKAGVKLPPGQIQDTSVHVQKLQLMNLDL